MSNIVWFLEEKGKWALSPFNLREFTFGNDRKGGERRREDKPVEDSRRKTSDRRRQEEPPSGQDVEVEEEKRGD